MDQVVQLRGRRWRPRIWTRRARFSLVAIAPTAFPDGTRHAFDVRYSPTRSSSTPRSTIFNTAPKSTYVRGSSRPSIWYISRSAARPGSAPAGNNFNLSGRRGHRCTEPGVSTTWKAHCRQLMLKIDRKSLESHLERAPVSTDRAAVGLPCRLRPYHGTWRELLETVFDLAAELAHNEAVAQSRFVCTQIEHTLLMLILCGAKHSYRDALRRRRAGLPQARRRRPISTWRRMHARTSPSRISRA